MGPQWFRRGFCDTISVAGRIIPLNCPNFKLNDNSNGALAAELGSAVRLRSYPLLPKYRDRDPNVIER